MDEARPGYYAVIPADVRYDDQIPANAKLLYGEISALIGKDGFCFATNQYFANIYGLSTNSVGRLISALEDAGYIKRELERDKSGQVTRRKLYLSVSLPDVQPLTNFDDTPQQNCWEGTPKNGEYTNTSITDIYKENKQRKSGSKKKTSTKGEESFDPMPLFQTWIGELDAERDEKNALYLAIHRLLKVREAKKKPWQTQAGVTGLCNRLMRLTSGDIRQMIELLDMACDCGWLTVYPPKSEQISSPAPDSGDEGRYGPWL